MKPTFSESDYERIGDRISAAEKGTNGEIVPYVVWRSDDYEVVTWRGTALAAVLFLIGTLLIYLFYDGWDLRWLYTGPGIVAGVVLFGLAGGIAVQTVRPLFLAVAGHNLVAHRARARAMRAFIDEGIFRTDGQTGVLIFISLWEHRIEVLPDTGIGAAVAPSAWESVVDAARGELKRGDLVEALIASVDACGKILKEVSPLAESKKDPNELEDSIRMGA